MDQKTINGKAALERATRLIGQFILKDDYEITYLAQQHFKELSIEKTEFSREDGTRMTIEISTPVNHD